LASFASLKHRLLRPACDEERQSREFAAPVNCAISHGPPLVGAAQHPSARLSGNEMSQTCLVRPGEAVGMLGFRYIADGEVRGRDAASKHANHQRITGGKPGRVAQWDDLEA
jgi:hypothetical protein